MKSKQMSDPKSGQRGHEHVVRIDAPADAVWRAITAADELVRWFPLTCEATPGEGGHITYRWAPDVTGLCRIESWEPPHHLRTTWFEAESEETKADRERRQLAVDWTIESESGHTILRLVHSGFGPEARWDEEFDGTRRGWNFELQALRHYLERHAGVERRAFWLRRPTPLPATQAWERLTVAGGILQDGSLSRLQPGERYRVRLVTGETVEGQVLVNAPPHDFAGIAENYNHGLFRLAYENCGAGYEAQIWLSTWGVPQVDVAALERRWAEALRQAFA